MKKTYAAPELVVIGKFEDVTLAQSSGPTSDANWSNVSNVVDTTPGAIDAANLLALNGLS